MNVNLTISVEELIRLINGKDKQNKSIIQQQARLLQERSKDAETNELLNISKTIERLCKK